MKLSTLSKKQIAAAERTLSAGTWAITAGAILFSVLTVTPLVERVTSDAWDWTAPILPLVVDAAVVIVIRLDSTVSRLGGDGGRWPVVLRWITGLFTIALNIGDSALKGDLVGVAVHAVAPTLLIVTAEAGLAYRRAIAKAIDRIDREHAEQAERERVHAEAQRKAREQEQREREQRDREERERAQDRQESLERERMERESAQEKQRLDHEARMAREQREVEEARRKDEADRAERRQEQERLDREAQAAREQQERTRREQQEQVEAEAARAAREQQDREARERAEQLSRERRERRTVNTETATVNTRKAGPVNTPAKPVVNTDRMDEEEARALVVNTPGASIRDLVNKTGWSVGWVSKVRNAAAGGDDQEVEEATAA